MSAPSSEHVAAQIEALWTWDLASDYLAVSAEYQRVTGIDQAGNVKPFHLLPYIVPEDRDTAIESLFWALAGEIPYDVRLRFVPPEGGERQILRTVRLIRDTRGNPAILHGRVRDVTGVMRRSRNREHQAEDASHLRSVVVAGEDRLARIGIRTLLSHCPNVDVVGEVDVRQFTQSQDVRLETLAANVGVDTVIIDVADRDEIYARFTDLVHELCPRVRIIAVVRPEALELVGHLAGCGVERLITSNVSSELLTHLVGGFAEAQAGMPVVERGTVEAVAPEVQIPLVPEGLSDVQLRVTRMLAAGLRNHEIAAELFVSEPTVKRHTQEIYRKLGARDRAHAAAIASRLGLS